MIRCDVVVIGGGAAGLMCAGVAARRGLSVHVLDRSQRTAEKIRISGGGRCNFTNLQADRPERFISGDPRLVRDVLRAYPPARFIELVRDHGIRFHEKHRGQLFCDESSEQIIDLLTTELARGGGELRQGVTVKEVRASDAGPWLFTIDTDQGTWAARQLVVACGGLSIPAIGASDFGHRLARQFGLRIVEPRPGLVPLRFAAADWQAFVPLAGLSLEVGIKVVDQVGAGGAVGGQVPAANAAARATFQEDLLFTHRGLSGPAILQISSYWRSGQALSIDLGGGVDVAGLLLAAHPGGRQQLDTVLGAHLPRRLVDGWLARSAHAALAGRRMAELSRRALEGLARDLRDWRLKPDGSEGFKKAEVTVGGIALDELDRRTLMAKRRPGLYFIGEVVDVTGWLGGYNFQWAWASGVRVGEALAAAPA